MKTPKSNKYLALGVLSPNNAKPATTIAFNKRLLIILNFFFQGGQ